MLLNKLNTLLQEEAQSIVPLMEGGTLNMGKGNTVQSNQQD